ncbi:hypothetical protein AOC05_08025 [Arthrobacter alpinus]|uniref:MarR family transcriptional regulator n=1 Tax=Arthrobacter alpinus TaxID=656366 RepID=A0A0M4QFK3_9MICC|nr:MULTISPECIES: DUF488 family protein [Arthrobacter]ALE92292.1 hypothetical protein AOC05_08025 [Arthrobacter alpinus]
MSAVRILRVYEQPEPGEFRVLVDRLWPRGISKDKVDVWLKEVAPSAEVRNEFDHQAKRFLAFQRHYRAELAANDAVGTLQDLLAAHPKVVLLYGAKDPIMNQAAVLLEFLDASGR